MVGMDMSFGTADFSTPHGGAPFQGWRSKGFGFGSAAGPGNSTANMPAQLRYTPKGDRCYASTPFWRTKWEVGQANSFGVGPRPDYGKQNDASIAPNNYGDVSKHVGKTRRISTRQGITLKPRFPSMEEKYRDILTATAGPGPSRDTCPPFGSEARSYTLRNKPILQGDLREQIGKPGPGGYETACKPGQNYPIKHGVLYDISMKWRTKMPAMGAVSPGPAKYQVKGKMDEYGLWEKKSQVKPSKPHGYWRRTLPDGHPAKPADDDQEGYEGEHFDGGFHHTQEMGDTSPSRRSLTRVESSPV